MSKKLNKIQEVEVQENTAVEEEVAAEETETPAEETDKVEEVVEVPEKKPNWLKRNWKKVLAAGAGAIAIVGGIAMLASKKNSSDDETDGMTEEDYTDLLTKIVAEGMETIDAKAAIEAAEESVEITTF